MVKRLKDWIRGKRAAGAPLRVKSRKIAIVAERLERYGEAAAMAQGGHPDYARTDIIGRTVNTAFLAMPFVAARCPGGIGITRGVVDELTEGAAADERGRVSVSGEPEALTVYEPRRSS